MGATSSRIAELLARAIGCAIENPAASDELLEEADALLETLTSKRAAREAAVVRARGVCQRARGDRAASNQSYLRALELLQELGHQYALERGQVQAYLADNYRSLGQADAALRHASAAVDELVRAWPLDRDAVLEVVPQIAPALGELNLGVERQLYRRLVDGAQDRATVLRLAEMAEAPLARHVETIDARVGPGSRHAADAREHLAHMYLFRGHHQRAEPLLEKALDIRRKHLPRDAIMYANDLVNVGRCRQRRGRYFEADDDYLNALRWYERSELPPSDRRVLQAVANRAELLCEWGRLSESEGAFGFVNQHGGVARFDVMLAELRLAQDRPRDAEELLYDALGRGLPASEEVSQALARACLGQGRCDDARRHLETARKLAPADDERTRLSCDLVEAQLLAATGDLAASIAGLGSITAELDRVFGTTHPHALAARHGIAAHHAALGHWRKCMDALSDARRATEIQLNGILSSGDRTQAHAHVTRLRRTVSLFLYALEHIEDRRAEDTRAGFELVTMLKGLETRTLFLQKSGKELPGRVTFELAFAQMWSIQHALADGAALVEFVKVHADTTRYIAFVLRKDTAEPVLVSLGAATEIDRTVDELWWVVSTTEPREIDGEYEWCRKARRVARRVWEPLAASLSGVDRLHIAPDDALWRLPFEILPAGRRLLMDDYTINYLLVGRELWRLRSELWTEAKPGPPLVVAAPDFGPARDGVVAFPPRPEMEAEGQVVAELLGTEACVGPAAMTTLLPRTPAPEIIHVATHGFYVRSADSTLDPMARSGLAFAGANAVQLGPAGISGDGVLLASQILGMDLRGTDLVCLSACETGLGELRAGEAVQGLRAAFRAAGCHSLICTLWRVPDASAAELMSAMYAKLLAERPRAQALALAKHALRTRYPNDPLHWAAFVLEGESEPLKRFSRQISFASVNMKRVAIEALQAPPPAALSGAERARRALDQARQYWSWKEPDLAIAATTAALALANLPVELNQQLRYARAGYLRQSGAWAEAIKEYESLLQEGVPRELECAALTDRGKALLLRSDYIEAVTAFTEAIAHAPAQVSAADILINRAAAHAALHDDAAETRDLDSAVLLDVGGAIGYRALVSRGLHRLRVHDAAGAHADFKRALMLAHDGHGDVDEASRLCAEARERSPSDIPEP